MTPELKAIVDEAYRVFAPYALERRLTVCHCPCCMAEETEHELLTTPLREIPSGTLAEYTNSAHGWDDADVAREMRHFLPRYLELIAAGDPPCTMGLDICLRRLGSAEWRKKWPAAESALLDRFLDALLLQSLANLELAEWPAGWRLDFDLSDVLTMVITAGGDLGRLLSCWDHSPDPAAAVHMAALSSDLLFETGRTYFYSAYLGDHREAADEIGRFLTRPEAVARIEAAFFAVEDPRLQQILSDGLRR